VWSSLERLEGLPPGAPERAALRAELQRTAARRAAAGKKRGDVALAYRSSVLSSELIRLDGFTPSPVRDPGIEFELLPVEALRVARAAGPGPTRTRALLLAFAELDVADALACEAIAGDVLAGELAAMRFDAAEAVGRAWLAHGADVGDSMLCARALRAAGRYEEARDLLADLRGLAAQAGEEARLALEAARLALATGNPEDAADHLGSALVRGSNRAAVVLGLEALRAGENGRALALVRPIREDEVLHPEARRLWATALLSRTEPLAPGVPRNPVPTASERP
jgi:hypothetical protein